MPPFSIGTFLLKFDAILWNAVLWLISSKKPQEIFFLNRVDLLLLSSKITILKSIKIPKKIYFFLGY